MAAAAATTNSHHSDEELFQAIESYPWNDDAEFQAGLAAILGPNTDPQQVERLTLRAQCFYYSRKNGNISVDFPAYVAWHSSHAQAAGMNGTVTHPTESQMRPTESTVEDVLSTSDEPPPYPMSFQEIVELISTGKPVPGIREIPDTLLEGQSTASTKPSRRKPWEKAEGTEAEAGEQDSEDVAAAVLDTVPVGQ